MRSTSIPPVSSFLVVAALALGPAACSSSEAHPAEPTVTAEARAEASSPPAVLSASTSASSAAGETTAAPVASTAPAAMPQAPLPKGLRVLVIGDSFAEALGAGLKSKEAQTGLKFVLRGEKATFIPEWAGPNKGLAGMMIQDKPDLVVIALGGNELAMVNPDIRAPKVKNLVALIKTTPCVWVSPPLWGNKDNGLLDVIRTSSTPCRYFDSNVLAPDLPRGGDKVHPTSEGQKKWAGHFLDWLTTERDASAATFALKARPGSE